MISEFLRLLLIFLNFVQGSLELLITRGFFLHSAGYVIQQLFPLFETHFPELLDPQHLIDFPLQSNVGFVELLYPLFEEVYFSFTSPATAITHALLGFEEFDP